VSCSPHEDGSKSALPGDARSVRFKFLTTPNSAHGLNVIAKHAPELREYEQLLISIDCVFDASLVPETCLRRFLDLKGLIDKFLESRVIGNLGTGSIFRWFHFPGFTMFSRNLAFADSRGCTLALGALMLR
jgi:hypothetical protein